MCIRDRLCEGQRDHHLAGRAPPSTRAVRSEGPRRPLRTAADGQRCLQQLQTAYNGHKTV
eukprot:1200873-Alexandrium_andersonii.AAC.1